MGPVSLRVERGALDALASTIAEAQRLLAERTADRDERPAAVVLTPQWAPRGRA